MSDPPPRCVRSDAPWSGAAVLATLSETHGIAVTAREIGELTLQSDTAVVDEGTLLVMARALGFEVAAMEGGYGDLGDVVLPIPVALREDGRDRYALLFAFDETSTQVGDPRTGEVTSWPRDRFCALWTGSVVQATPLEDERRAFATRLADLRDPVKRAKRLVGWEAPYGPKVAMVVAIAAVLAAAVASPHATPTEVAYVTLVALACVGSLWSWLGAGSCARCSRARLLAGGLPLAPAGAALYLLLLASLSVPIPGVVPLLALGAAVGAHVALVTTLVRARVTCPPCLFVAACAFGLTGLLLGAPLPAPVWAAFACAAVAAAGALFVLIPLAQARDARISRETAEALGRAAIAESGASAGVRVIAFKRVGCGSCAFFEAAVKPALLATYEGAFTLQERDLGDARTGAPLVLVLGARRTLFIGLPIQDAPARIIEAVREAIESEPQANAPMTVIAG